MSTKFLKTMVLSGFLTAFSLPVLAYEATEGDRMEEGEGHKLILEVGPSIDHSFSDQSNIGGGSLSLEYVAIKDVLAIEVGSTLLSGNGETNFDSKVLFKKPFEISHNAEITVGAGPSLTNKLQGDHATDYGMVMAVELMVWQTERLGWFVSPEYSHGIGVASGDQSFGGTVGILVGW